MLIRISLILAIVAGLATAALNFLQVKKHIDETIAERNDWKTKKEQEERDKKTAQKLAKDTQTKLDATTAELTATKDERDKAVAEAAAQIKRADDLAGQLKKTQDERDLAQNDLAAWKALGIPIEQIKTTLNSIKFLTEKNEAIQGENVVLNSKVRKLQAKIDEIMGIGEVQEPEGLRGKVLVADPKFEFVVLDIGEKDGVLEHGKLLVNRNGRLIAKVRIESVDKNRCIANVVPGWKLGEIQEGDQVIY